MCGPFTNPTLGFDTEDGGSIVRGRWGGTERGEVVGDHCRGKRLVATVSRDGVDGNGNGSLIKTKH